jgi:2-phospho-L-lactate guanylyltransferase
MADVPPLPLPYTFVLPVKALSVAKSRVDAAPEARAALALAMAVDVAAAAGEVGRVLVVTDDERAATALAVDHVEPDVPGAGLSAALAHGAAVAAARWPDDGVVLLAADLPCLTAAALTAVLHTVPVPARSVPAGSVPARSRSARQPRHAGTNGVGVVADASGVGTVLLAATAGTVVHPAYEGGSFAAHRGQGAADLTGYAAPGLRRDVDTVADLQQALAIGIGPATAAALAAYRESWRRVGVSGGQPPGVTGSVHLGL